MPVIDISREALPIISGDSEVLPIISGDSKVLPHKSERLALLTVAPKRSEPFVLRLVIFSCGVRVVELLWLEVIEPLDSISVAKNELVKKKRKLTQPQNRRLDRGID